MKLKPGTFCSQLYLIFLVLAISWVYRCVSAPAVLNEGFNYREVFFK